jgi:hypothetical protein
LISSSDCGTHGYQKHPPNRLPWRRDQGIELLASSYSRGKSRTRTRWVHGTDTERQIASLVTAELVQVNTGKLAVEEPIEFLVLGRLLTIGH